MAPALPYASQALRALILNKVSRHVRKPHTHARQSQLIGPVLPDPVQAQASVFNLLLRDVRSAPTKGFNQCWWVAMHDRQQPCAYAGTRNVLQQELASPGNTKQYKHISVKQPMRLPDQDTLALLTDVQETMGSADDRSDCVDALSVAAHCLLMQRKGERLALVISCPTLTPVCLQNMQYQLYAQAS